MIATTTLAPVATTTSKVRQITPTTARLDAALAGKAWKLEETVLDSACMVWTYTFRGDASSSSDFLWIDVVVSRVGGRIMRAQAGKASGGEGIAKFRGTSVQVAGTVLRYVEIFAALHAEQ